MAWVRIHDGAMGNLKILRLTDSAFRLWVRGLCYCQLNLTDGFIPVEAFKQQLPARPPDLTLLSRPQVEGRSALWEAVVGGYRVHDYLDYNDSREAVSKKRRDAKERIANVRKKFPKSSHEQSTNSPLGLSSSRTEDPVNELAPATREPEPRVALEPSELVRWFDRVYAAYPNKERKLAANERWVHLAPDLATAQAILKDIQQRKAAGWVRLERRFIPHLVRFLDERQWEDAPIPGPIWEDDGPHAWRCATCGEIHEGSAQEQGRCLKLKPAEIG